MQTIPEEKIRSASEGLRALAHEVRLSVLCHLMNGPLCVQDLMQATGSSQSNLSQHLAKMRMMGLVKTEKEGQRVIYSIASPEIGGLLDALRRMYCPDDCTDLD
jgi:DNA-binding transcriptional ArsR family regulator